VLFRCTVSVTASLGETVLKLVSSPTSIVAATIWMVGVLASFSAMAIAGRELSSELTTFQILFFRSVVGLVVVSALLTKSGWGQVKTKRIGHHLLRNMIHFAAQYGWFLGIAFLPLAEVFAIEFTTPIWTAILAVFFLGERATKSRVISIALGFAGILVILQPGAQVVSLPALAVLGAAIGYAMSYVFTKSLSRVDSPLTIIFFMTVIQLPMAFVPALTDWTVPSYALWPWVVIVGVSALSAHYCIARALKLADAMVVVPMDFLRLPLIAVVGIMIYAEPLDIWVLIGGLIVFGGNLLNIYSSTRIERKAAKGREAS